MKAGNSSNFILTEDMIEQFYCEGYFYAPKFITMDTVDALNKENQVFADAESDGKWRSKQIIHIEKEREAYPETTSFLTSSEGIRVFERILGGTVRFWIGMYAVVAPQGNGLEWHQDNQYTHILGHVLNVFIALETITQENAGLWLAPRSHRFGRQPN